jgi:alcohol dehydrogenase class IV
LQHGHAVALTLGSFFEINYYFQDKNVIDPRGEDYLKNTMVELFNMFKVSSSIECKEKWYKLMKSIRLEQNLEKLNISTEGDINKIIDNINLVRLNNNPVRINVNIVRDIFREKCLNE